MLVIVGLGVIVALGSKSALVGLHSWLLDAMEGPTPVSALLHSATLVCAGVVVAARWLWCFGGLAWLLCLGLTVVIMAGFIGLWLMDVKRVVAYSTMVHVGLMVAGLGCSAACGYLCLDASVGMAHLFSHS